MGAKGMIFALAHSGVCAAFCRETNKRLCYLNIQDDEVVRSLFYNKNNETLITVSVYATDNYSSLKCRSTPLEFIRRGKPQEGGMALFEEESLQWPGFVEFDDVNGKVLTYNAHKHVYKVFDLKNYELLYDISDAAVSELKVSPGILLLIHDYEGKDHVPLKILSVEDGNVLKEFKHDLLDDLQERAGELAAVGFLLHEQHAGILSAMGASTPVASAASEYLKPQIYAAPATMMLMVLIILMIVMIMMIMIVMILLIIMIAMITKCQ